MFVSNFEAFWGLAFVLFVSTTFLLTKLMMFYWDWRIKLCNIRYCQQRYELINMVILASHAQVNLASIQGRSLYGARSAELANSLQWIGKSFIFVAMFAVLNGGLGYFVGLETITSHPWKAVVSVVIGWSAAYFYFLVFFLHASAKAFCGWVLSLFVGGGLVSYVALSWLPIA